MFSRICTELNHNSFTRRRVPMELCKLFSWILVTCPKSDAGFSLACSKRGFHWIIAPRQECVCRKHYTPSPDMCWLLWKSPGNLWSLLLEQKFIRIVVNVTAESRQASSPSGTNSATRISPWLDCSWTDKPLWGQSWCASKAARGRDFKS